ncbi:hypothetical protein [Bacteroidetes bacterium endosymbiont of Geopemphigus sp.]
MFFLKPDTALPRKGEEFIIPRFTNEIDHEIEIALKMSKSGKYI